MPHFLRKSIGAWSAGTRVVILSSWTEPEEVVFAGGSKDKKIGLADIRIMAGAKPVLHAVLLSDIVERGKKS